MDSIIRVENLRKNFNVLRRPNGFLGSVRSFVAPQYQEVRAVDGVSFRLGEGELVGYLGPNGAGKSTTLKILTGLLVPTSGLVSVGGMTPWKDRTAYVAQIGAVFGQRTTLWWDLPIIDSFELLQPMYRIPMDRFKKNLDEFTALLEMESFMNTPVRSLSLGQRMRADLCAALLHEPRLVFLDEPTIGLDVVAKERIRQFILYANRQRSTTIILTTHDLADVEKLCERVIILDLGRVLYDGLLSDLIERFEEYRILQVTFGEDYRDVNLPGAAILRRNGPVVEYRFDWRQLSAADLIARLMQHYRVIDLEVHRPELEQTIRRIYEEKLLVGSG